MKRRRGTVCLSAILVTLAFLGNTGDLSAGQVYPPEWGSLDVAGLTDVANALAAQSDSAQRRALASYVAARLAATTGADRPDQPQWLNLARQVSLWGPRSTKDTLIQNIREKMVPDTATVAALSLADLRRVWETIAALGGEWDAARDIAATWICASERYKALTAQQLRDVAFMVRYKGSGLAAAQRWVIDHLTQQYMGSQGAIRSLTCNQWHDFIFFLRFYFPSETRSLWKSKLREVFTGSPAALGSLNAAEFRSLVDGLNWLEEPRLGDLALAWFRACGRWTDGSADDLARIGGYLRHAEDKARDEVLADLDTLVTARDGGSPLTWLECRAVASLWLRMGNPDKAQPWVLKAYERALGSDAARATADHETLRKVSDVLRDVEMTGEGKGHEAFAKALVSMARRNLFCGNEFWTVSCFARPLGTPETRQIVRDALIDANGDPRLGVARILSYAYRNAGQTKSWSAFLDQQVAAAEAPDRKALWLLTRAYAESVLSRRRSPLRGKPWLDQALDTAATPSVRLPILRELVEGYVFVGRYEDALGLLADAGGQFPAESRIHVAALQNEVQASKEHAARQAQEARARAATLQRKELSRRLEAARVKGDAEAIARYERLLGTRE